MAAAIWHHRYYAARRACANPSEIYRQGIGRPMSVQGNGVAVQDIHAYRPNSLSSTSAALIFYRSAARFRSRRHRIIILGMRASSDIIDARR